MATLEERYGNRMEGPDEMTTRDEITDQLRNYIRAEFEIEADDGEFTDDVHLFDYGYVDSLGAVKLMGYIEEAFGVEITNKDLMMHAMNTLNEIAAVVADKVAVAR